MLHASHGCLLVNVCMRAPSWSTWLCAHGIHSACAALFPCCHPAVHLAVSGLNTALPWRHPTLLPPFPCTQPKQVTELLLMTGQTCLGSSLPSGRSNPHSQWGTARNGWPVATEVWVAGTERLCLEEAAGMQKCCCLRIASAPSQPPAAPCQCTISSSCFPPSAACDVRASELLQHRHKHHSKNCAAQARERAWPNMQPCSQVAACPQAAPGPPP